MKGGKERITERIKVQLVLKENIGCIRVKIKCEGGFMITRVNKRHKSEEC